MRFPQELSRIKNVKMEKTEPSCKGDVPFQILWADGVGICSMTMSGGRRVNQEKCEQEILVTKMQCPK